MKLASRASASLCSIRCAESASCAQLRLSGFPQPRQASVPAPQGGVIAPRNFAKVALAWKAAVAGSSRLPDVNSQNKRKILQQQSHSQMRKRSFAEGKIGRHARIVVLAEVLTNSVKRSAARSAAIRAQESG